MSDTDQMNEVKKTKITDQRTHNLSVEERQAMGERARKKVPLEAHAEWTPPSNRADPIGLLIDSSEGRREDLIAIRYGRMLASPFAFYRGSAAIMAYDLSRTPNSGINLQVCGDCHLLNFGGFATPERNVIFDINDFDETSIGPWEWDVKRLAASFVIAGRSNGFAAEDSYKAGWLAADYYRLYMAEIGQKPILAAWYEAMDLNEVLDRAPDPKRARFYRKKLAKAAKRSAHEKQFAKLAHSEGHPARIIDRPPLIFHHDDYQHNQAFRAAVEEGYAHYKESLSPELSLLLDRYRIEDVAYKVVGVGSVGTVCGIILLMSAGDPLFLQFKEATPSVLEPYAGASPSPFIDETATRADLIMPDHTYLESWGYEVPAPGAVKPAVSSQQPVVKPLYDTRSTGDVLISVADRLGDRAALSLPWPDEVSFLQELAVELHGSSLGAYDANTPDSFWALWRQYGGWWTEKDIPREPEITTNTQEPLPVYRPVYSGDEQEFPFHLLPYTSLTLSDGRGANLPWLQGTPDPMSTVSWGTWVELNPATADSLGVHDNDVVRVISPHGELEAPVVIYPGIRPDVVAIPVGQGHNHFGRFAQRRGSNPISLISVNTDPDSGSLAWGATRVRVEPTGEHKTLARLESLAGEGRESLD